MNNYEKIKNMSIEEMENSLNKGFFHICYGRKCDVTCLECYKNWLREVAKWFH